MADFERASEQAQPAVGDETLAQDSATVTPRCPFCQSLDTEPLALFGSQLSTAHYYCRACHTPFAYMRKEIQ